jgi:gliding motility associated protien GldN
MQLKKLLTLAIFSMVTLVSSAQMNLEYWPYEKKSIQERKVISHRPTSEAAVKYHKRIDRVIDLRQKQNKPMVWPRSNIVEILHTAAVKGPNREGGITVYETRVLENGSKLSPKAVASKGVDTFQGQTVDTVDGVEVILDTPIAIPLDIRSIVKLRIMEDWIFDHKYSDFRVRIVAIAPLYNMTSSGIDLGEQPLFWVKMDDARELLANREVFNPANDHSNLSFDDWFEKRMFSSYIVKESNITDMDIKHQEAFADDGLGQLLEADRIKNDLFIFEHDTWEY